MNSDSLKNGIVGVMLGAGILAGSGYNPADVDSVTGVTYEEINRNPELDVYYIVETASIVAQPELYLETSHQKNIANIKKSIDGVYSVLKYDVGTVVRSVELGKPYTNGEIVEYIRNPENGFINIDAID